MQKIEDDATITQLCTSWVYTAAGGEKTVEAHAILSDLIEKYGATTLLLNALIVCSLHLKKYNEAEKLLSQALEKVLCSSRVHVNTLTDTH